MENKRLRGEVNGGDSFEEIINCMRRKMCKERKDYLENTRHKS